MQIYIDVLFPKKTLFQCPLSAEWPPEYPALPDQAAGRSGISGSPGSPCSPVYLQPVYLKQTYIPKFPQHAAPRQPYAVRAAALMPAHAYRALVFEYVARAQFPKAQIMRPPVFEQAKCVFAVYGCCSLHCFFLCSPEYPALPDQAAGRSGISVSSGLFEFFIKCPVESIGRFFLLKCRPRAAYAVGDAALLRRAVGVGVFEVIVLDVDFFAVGVPRLPSAA